MGHIFAELQLSNPRRPDLRPISVNALADTGALMLCLPEHLAIQLELEAETSREVTVADGRSMKVPNVGPIKVHFRERICYVGALVLGDEVQLGAVLNGGHGFDTLAQPAKIHRKSCQPQ